MATTEEKKQTKKNTPHLASQVFNISRGGKMLEFIGKTIVNLKIQDRNNLSPLYDICHLHRHPQLPLSKLM